MPSVSPDQIIVEFFSANGEPLRLLDLGTMFLETNKIPSSDAIRPFKVAVNKKESKAGNAYYEYSQNSVPLPDGLNTFIKVEGSVVAMGKIRPSKKGYPTREGSAQVLISDKLYSVTGYLTESSAPYYIKIVAHKTPDRSGLQKAQMAPRGGRIIL